jgi:phosphohistidine phosphatase
VLLLLARHADAGVPDPLRWPGDADRPLTDLGRETQRRVSERLRDAGWSPTVVVSSPLLRARQTAEIIADVCGVNAPIMMAEALADRSVPSEHQQPDVNRLADEIGARSPADVVALVGHTPSLDELASLLLTGSPDTLSIDFSKSAIMVVRAEAIAPAAGELVAFLQP